jgi:hypothetical protein
LAQLANAPVSAEERPVVPTVVISAQRMLDTAPPELSNWAKTIQVWQRRAKRQHD